MATPKKRSTTENFFFSASIALLGLITVLSTQLGASVERHRDTQVLTEGMNAVDPVSAGLESLPDGTMIYKWQKDSDIHFGAIVAAGDPGYSALVAAAFSRTGEVEALRFVGSPVSNHIARDEAFLSVFLGNASAGPRKSASSLAAESVSGDRAQAFMQDFARNLRSIARIIARKGRGASP